MNGLGPGKFDGVENFLHYQVRLSKMITVKRKAIKKTCFLIVKMLYFLRCV